MIWSTTNTTYFINEKNRKEKSKTNTTTCVKYVFCLVVDIVSIISGFWWYHRVRLWISNNNNHSVNHKQQWNIFINYGKKETIILKTDTTYLIEPKKIL